MRAQTGDEVTVRGRHQGDEDRHAPVLEVAGQAVRHGVRRLVFAHIGRPTIAALDKGHVPPFGEIGTEGAVYTAGDQRHPLEPHHRAPSGGPDWGGISQRPVIKA